MEFLNIVMRTILLYGILLGGSIFLAEKTNKKIEHCIAPNIGMIILVLYIFGICDCLIYGVWFISIINLLLGGYTLIKNGKNLKEKVMTPGFTFFTLLFFVLLITTHQRNLVDYDHYLYRSFDTKIMYYTDCINKGFPSLYPPAINLLEYFFMKVMGAYVQGFEAFAVQLFGFSLFLPLWDRRKNTKFMNAIITIIILCIPAIFHNLIFYESAYPDALLGIIIGYSLYVLCVEKESKFRNLVVPLALSITTILKPSGFYIALIVIGIYGFIQLQSKGLKKKEQRKLFWRSQEWKTIVVMVLTIGLIFTTWKIFTKINNQYNTGVTRAEQARVGNTVQYMTKNILTTVLGYYEENHDSADSNESLLPKLYTTYAIASPTKISLYGSILIILLLGIFSYRYVIKQEDKKEYKYQIIALNVGLVVYILFLQVSYLLKFSTEEMLGHNGIDRYLPTFLLGMIYFIVAMVLKQMEEKGDRKLNYVLLMVVILMFTPVQSIATSSILSGIYNIQSVEYCNNGRMPAIQINEKIPEKAEVISISQEEKTNLYSLMLRYYLYPDHKVYPYEKVNEKVIHRIKDNIVNQKVEYLYIWSTNETLNQWIKKEFNNEIELKKETLYHITIEENQIQLNEIPLD